MQSKLRLAIAASLVLMLCGASFAQDRDHDRGHDRYHKESSRDRHNDHHYRASDRHEDRYRGNNRTYPYVGSGGGTYAHSPYYGAGQYGGYSTSPYYGG